MMSLHGCPRCSGAVVDDPIAADDDALCVNCGWRRADIPLHIQTEVAAHLGKPYMGDRYTHHRIGKGKPPLSGWDQIKQRRARSACGYDRPSDE